LSPSGFFEPREQLRGRRLIRVTVDSHAQRDDLVDLHAAVWLVDPPAATGALDECTGAFR
jgi:hypothetical protein